MQSVDKSREWLDLGRYYNPFEPIVRSFKTSILFGISEIIFLIGIYYYAYRELGGGFASIYTEMQNPVRIMEFPVGFWTSILMVYIAGKLFKRYATVIGTIIGEIIVEIYEYNKIIPSIMLLVIIFVIFTTIHKYKGGEYIGLKGIGKKGGIGLVGLTIFSIMSYFIISINGPIPQNLNEKSLKIYLSLNIFINLLIPLFVGWIFFYLLDKRLWMFFPLEASRMQELKEAYQKAMEHPDRYQDDYELFMNIPQPGELYIQSLSHHPLVQDDHTFPIVVGKVKVYLCSRCTGMVFGAILTILYSKMLAIDFGYMISQKTAFILVCILPVIPLTDWGLQAAHIRKATTGSRLSTGFILGINISLITFCPDYQPYVIMVTVIYFVVFSFLAKIREKKRKQIEDLLYLDNLTQI